MPIKRSILTLIFAIALFPSVKNAFLWHEDAILQGEIWRVLTGNLAHSNHWHALGNGLAFWCITLSFEKHRWILLSLLLGLGIGLGLFFTNTERYVGFSGVLYGLFFYAVIREKNTFLATCGVGKLIWDQWLSDAAQWNEWIQAPIALQAHWLGAIFGVLLAVTHNKIR